jgi:hypothetical protein
MSSGYIALDELRVQWECDVAHLFSKSISKSFAPGRFSTNEESNHGKTRESAIFLNPYRNYR